MSGADLHVGLRVADGGAQLIARAAGDKDGEGGRERQETLNGQAGGDGELILLGRAAIDVSVRKFLLEIAGLGGLGYVGVEHEQFGQFGGEFEQGVHIALPGLFEFAIHQTSSWRARLHCSRVGGVPCHSAAFSMKDTPRPFVVLRMIMAGLPESSRAWATAPMMALKS